MQSVVIIPNPSESFHHVFQQWFFEFAAPVRVKHPNAFQIVIAHEKCLFYQFTVLFRPDRPTDHFRVKEILNGAQITPGLSYP